MRISDWSSDVCSSDLSVKGQYTSGAVSGQAVSGYADELGNPSNTETFVALKAFIDNWRWKGVPFYLRTGKRMPPRHSEVLIQFQPVPPNIFARVRSAARRVGNACVGTIGSRWS